MGISTIIDKTLERNIHHIFTYNEIREKIVEIFGEPETNTEHIFIQQETRWVHKKMPCYKLPIRKHRLIHIVQGTNKRRIRSYKLVLAGLKGLKKEESSHKEDKR